MRTHANHAKPNGAVRAAAGAAMLAIVAAAVTSGTTLADQGRGPVEPARVVGTGPHAVYVGPGPSFGGDPARGETEESYFARTGRHLPGLSSAVDVDGPWWYGRAPVFGGDPASGETEDSYLARTGRHLPASVPSVAPVGSDAGAQPVNTDAAEQWLTPDISAGLECRPDAAQRWRVPNIPLADLPRSADAAERWLTPEIAVADLPRSADAAERWLCFAS